MLQDILAVSSGFQSSVNIAYDFNDSSKISGFIPTTSALSVIENILINTETDNKERAKILTGAYGRGKSHIVLVALSILYNKSKEVFNDLLKKINGIDKDTAKRISNYIDSSKRLLPVIVTGAGGSLSQSFLRSLQQALNTYELNDIMPETNYSAASETIARWKNDFPDTYNALKSEIRGINKFEGRLSNGDEEAYRKFVEIYPKLTSGAVFNPFVNSDVVEIYDKVNEELHDRGYSGLYIVYDEFGKYLETNISKTSESDMKLLQDLAEKCNRESRQQMHLMLICHKDISNYIDDGLPKDKVDGWRGISGRFEHLQLTNNFHQMYEDILKTSKNGNYLSGKEELVVYDCYPLHPVTTFLLPRLSEKIAQNERTLFTFLTSNQKNTLNEYIENCEDAFPIMTPDRLYDYFEQELRKELKSSELHKVYYLSAKLLQKTESKLEQKIIKTIAVIYCVAQFERIAPTLETICDVYSAAYDRKEITDTVNDLISRKFIVYRKSSNNFLCLKESSGVDIEHEIGNEVSKLKDTLDVEAALNKAAGSSYLYPVRHNEEKCLTRYFAFRFIEYSKLSKETPPQKSIGACGSVLGVIFKDEIEFESAQKKKRVYKADEFTVLIIPETYNSVSDVVYRYLAAKDRRDSCSPEDIVLRSEYEMVADDLESVIFGFVSQYTKPELRRSSYYYLSRKQDIIRKSAFSELLSYICDRVYPNTPVINNESINKDRLPGVAVTSRTKLCTAILECTEGASVPENLGLIGTGQDVSFMRSTLIRTGILNTDENGCCYFDEQNCEPSIAYVLNRIRNFFVSTATEGEKPLAELYDILVGQGNGIGMKKGAIPVYLAVVLRTMKDSVVFKSNGYEIKINVDALNSINEKPAEYSVMMVDWNDDKMEYLQAMEGYFSDYIIEKERAYNCFAYIANAIDRWYLSLPKCSRELSKRYTDDKSVKAAHKKFYNLLRSSKVNSHEFLMNRIPEAFGEECASEETAEAVFICKTELDKAKGNLIERIVKEIKQTFSGGSQDSVRSVLIDWTDRLSEKTKQHVFPGNENQILSIMSSVSNDEVTFAERLSKAVTGLRIDDWSHSVLCTFNDSLQKFKSIVEDYDSNCDKNDDIKGKQYKIITIDESGKESVHSFERTEYGRHAQLLYRDITGALSDIGQSVSEQEKRQILFEILESLC